MMGYGQSAALRQTPKKKATALYFDNQQYCICRRGDDGLVFMIECESCKEWFHGDCVGVCKQLAARINQYICIGCARVVNDIDLWSKQTMVQ